MASYGPLASFYDSLTGDVPYEQMAERCIGSFSGATVPVRTVLDLGCGTGTLSLLLARRGYEMICTDASADMLSEFQQKLWDLPPELPRPMLLCQPSQELDLYGTVDAALCTLDGFNYLSPAELAETLRRLRLFIVPGGVLSFDVLTPEHMRSLDGQCFVDERDGLLCLWRASVEDDELHYGMDIFTKERRGLWSRRQEEHTEYLHNPEELRHLLTAAGFTDVRQSSPEPGRLFFTCLRNFE